MEIDMVEVCGECIDHTVEECENCKVCACTGSQAPDIIVL